jgi:hypothetical protein
LGRGRLKGSPVVRGDARLEQGTAEVDLLWLPTAQSTAEVAAAPNDAEVRARLSEAFGCPITVVSVQDVELDAAQWERAPRTIK